MTRAEAIEWLEIATPIRELSTKDYKRFMKAITMAIASLETDEAYQLEYERTTKNDLGVDAVSRQAVLDLIADYDLSMGQVVKGIHALPSLTPQEPRCKDCKWWKDSDGEYRRGCGAESICRINTDKVYQGEGYCYMFEPQESEDKE